MQRPGMLQKQCAVGRLDQEEKTLKDELLSTAGSLKKLLAEAQTLIGIPDSKPKAVENLPPGSNLKGLPMLTRSHAEKIETKILFQQDLADFALVSSEDNQTLLLNGLPNRDHGFQTLAELCDFIGAVCLSYQEQLTFNGLVAEASASDALPSAQISMLSFLLRVLNEYCAHHQSNTSGGVPTLACVCPDKMCPVFVIRLLSGSPALLRALKNSFGFLNTDVLTLSLRLTWRLYHLAHVCAPRCSRFRCLTLSDDNVSGSFWGQLVSEISELPSLREPAFLCVVGLMVERTEADLTEVAEACLFREDVVNPWLIPYAFALLRGTDLSFQLKGLTDLFSSLLGQGSNVYPVHYIALSPDHELGVLNLLSDLSMDEYKDATITADIEITLLAYLATATMNFFKHANFSCCISRTMSILNAFGPPGDSLRRVHIMRQFLMSIMKLVRQETGNIDRNMGQAFLNFLDLAGVILQFVLYHGYQCPSGASHFPNLADLSATSFLPLPLASPHPPRPFSVSLQGPIKLHLSTRQGEPPWSVVVEDVQLLRMMEETCKSLDFNPELYRGPEDVRRSLRVGQLLHNTLGCVLGVMQEASLHDPRVNLVATPYPSRRKPAVTKSISVPGEGRNTFLLAVHTPSPHTDNLDNELPLSNPDIARFDSVAPPRESTCSPQTPTASGVTPTTATTPTTPTRITLSDPARTPRGRRGRTEVKVVLPEDTSTPQEKIAAQAQMTKVIQDLVTSLETMLASHDASLVFKYFQSRTRIDPVFLPTIIMEGTLLLSHGANVKSVSAYLEPEFFCYLGKDSRHVVPLAAIKYIEPDVAHSEAKGPEEELIPACFSLVSKVDSFVVTCRDSEERDIWVNLISFATARIRMETTQQGDCLDGLYVLASPRFKKSAQALRAAHSHSNTLYAFRNIRVSSEKPAALKIQKTNVVPLYTADMVCTSCTASLSVFRRIQHCRNCGRGFCNKCVSKLRGTRFNMSKICYKCYVELDERDDTNRSVLVELSGGKAVLPTFAVNEGLKRGKATVDLMVLPSNQLREADNR